MNKAKTPIPFLPTPPEHLPQAAKEVWTSRVALLSRMTKFTTGENVLTSADLDKLEVYCVTFVFWKEAVRQAAEFGQVIREGGGHRPNPFVAIANAAARQLRQLAEDFGFSPGSRAKMGIQFHEGSAE